MKLLFLQSRSLHLQVTSFQQKYVSASNLQQTYVLAFIQDAWTPSSTCLCPGSQPPPASGSSHCSYEELFEQTPKFLVLVALICLFYLYGIKVKTNSTSAACCTQLDPQCSWNGQHQGVRPRSVQESNVSNSQTTRNIGPHFTHFPWEWVGNPDQICASAMSATCACSSQTTQGWRQVRCNRQPRKC